MHELLNCLVCSKSFITNGELIEHLEEHKMTPSSQRQTHVGGISIPDKDLIKRRRTEDTASVEELGIDPEMVKPGMLFKSRPLDQGTGSYVIDNVSAKKERIAVAMRKHGSSLSRAEQDAAESDKILNQATFINSDHRLMDTDILLSKPEHPEPTHHAFREIWVKLYECTICCTPFSDKESCESHYEAHLTKPPLPQVEPKALHKVVPQSTHMMETEKPKIITLRKVADNERHLIPSSYESQTDDVKPSSTNSQSENSAPLSSESQTANVAPSSTGLHTEDIVPSSSKSQSQVFNGIIPKTEPQDVISPMRGRMYLCYVCYAEFTDQDACNAHIEQHTQTMQPTSNSMHPNHAIPGMSQHGTDPSTSTIEDKDLSSSEFLSDAIHENSNNEDEDFKPDPEDSRSSGSTGEEASPNEITEPLVLVHEDNYIIPSPDITYECHVCKKGYDNKSSCVKHVITHIKHPGKNEGTSDAGNLADIDQLDSAMLPPEGRIVSVLLEKMTNSPEECEKGKPHNQYVVSFYQEGPGNSLDDQLPTLYQCQICKMKFKERSSCQSHVKTHAVKSSEIPLETKGATTAAEDTIGPDHLPLVLKDIVAAPEQQKIEVKTDLTFYQCHVCKKKFSDQLECESHILCHLKPPGGDIEDVTGKQHSADFKCSLCPYWFFTEATFRDHNLTHFVCKVCGQTNLTEEALSHHYNVIHPGYQELSGGEAEAIEQNTVIEDHLEPLSDDSKEDPDYEVKRVRRQRFTSRRIRHKPIQQKFHKACEVCEKVFNKKIAYINHVASHNRPLSVECELCAEKFINKHKLRLHNHEVHVRSPLVCELCGKVFKSRRPYQIHMAEHASPPPPKACSVCAKTFDSDEELAKHMIGHGPNQPTTCVICGHQYKRNQANFIGHLKEHANEPEQCLVCKETFPTFKEYRIHAATHSGSKSVICKDCGNSFATPRSLVEHIKQQHTKEHQFICEECGKGFLKKDKFLRHMQTHTGVKPYKCEYCDHTAGHKWDLLKHLGQHTGARPHMCHQCGKTYPARAYLTHHIRTSCKAGPRTTKAKPRVKKTIPTTPTEDGIYPCVICLDAFTKAGALTRHIKKWHPDQAQASEVQSSGDQLVGDQPGDGESILEQGPV